MEMNEFVNRYARRCRRIIRLYEMYGDAALDSIRVVADRVADDMSVMVNDNMKNGVDDSNIFNALSAAGLSPIRYRATDAHLIVLDCYRNRKALF